MGYAEASTVIHAPLEATWNCLNDIEHTPEWVVGLEAARIRTSSPFGVGTVYYDHNRLGPFPQVTAWKVTVFELLSRQVHESVSTILPSTMTLNLSPASEGTNLQMSVDYRFLPQLGPVGKVLEHLVMNRLLGQVLKQNQIQLNNHLQSKLNSNPGARRT